MGKRQHSPPQIDHPRFSKQGRHRNQVRTATGTFFVHVSQLLEFIEYDTLLRTTPASQALRQPAPLGYDLVANTWNAQTTSSHFATICHGSTTAQPVEIVALGQPILMTDFLVTPDNCGLSTSTSADSEMQAFTRYIAMEAIYSRQRCEAQQWLQRTRQMAGFGLSHNRDCSVRRRYDHPDGYHIVEDVPVGASSSNDAHHFETSFGGLGQLCQSAYIDIDEDASMSAQEAGNTTVTGSIADITTTTIADIAATALANVKDLQELPQFNPEDCSGLDFSLLGDTDVMAKANI